MQKIFLDTNIWMRYFIGDDKAQYQQSQELFNAISEGRFQVYTSTIVLLEVHFVAKKLYGIPKDQILLWFKLIMELRGLTLIERTNFALALKYHGKYGVKLADCMIAAQMPVNCKLITFDQEFGKIKEVKPIKPQEALDSIAS